MFYLVHGSSFSVHRKRVKEIVSLVLKKKSSVSSTKKRCYLKMFEGKKLHKRRNTLRLKGLENKTGGNSFKKYFVSHVSRDVPLEERTCS